MLTILLPYFNSFHNDHDHGGGSCPHPHPKPTKTPKN
jgi:hypothetical protein